MTTIPRWAMAGILLVLLFATAHRPQPSIVKVTLVQSPQPTALSRVVPQAVAKELLTPVSYVCWAKIVKQESHFNPQAKSDKSDATGIGQLLKSTYVSLGMRPTDDGTAQLVAMLAYVNRRFGGHNALCSAWKYKLRFGTY